MATVRELAREAHDAMQRATRDDGSSYVRIRDDAPEWVSDLAYHAHGDMLPDDWRYGAIREALEVIAENGTDDDERHSFADDVDVYNSDLLAWVGSDNRIGYVDEAREETGPAESFMQDVMRGQYLERGEVFDLVAAFLSEREDEDED